MQMLLWNLIHHSCYTLYNMNNYMCRLFLVCQKANAVLTSEVCNKTTVVNFASTSEGLQDQLLSLVIKLVSYMYTEFGMAPILLIYTGQYKPTFSTIKLVLPECSTGRCTSLPCIVFTCPFRRNQCWTPPTLN